MHFIGYDAARFRKWIETLSNKKSLGIFVVKPTITMNTHTNKSVFLISYQWLYVLRVYGLRILHICIYLYVYVSCTIELRCFGD